MKKGNLSTAQKDRPGRACPHMLYKVEVFTHPDTNPLNFPLKSGSEFQREAEFGNS